MNKAAAAAVAVAVAEAGRVGGDETGKKTSDHWQTCLDSVGLDL